MGEKIVLKMHFPEHKHFPASKYNYMQHILLIKNYFILIPFLKYKRLFLRKLCVIHKKQKLNKMLLNKDILEYASTGEEAM